jgi:hypothetical protein
MQFIFIDNLNITNNEWNDQNVIYCLHDLAKNIGFYKKSGEFLHF